MLGEVFEGNWDKNGLKHGIGRLKFADGSIYEGKFKEGVFAGLGKLTLQDGSKYEGKYLEKLLLLYYNFSHINLDLKNLASYCRTILTKKNWDKYHNSC